jgi:hypothetical protein
MLEVLQIYPFGFAVGCNVAPIFTIQRDGGGASAAPGCMAMTSICAVDLVAFEERRTRSISAWRNDAHGMIRNSLHCGVHIEADALFELRSML